MMNYRSNVHTIQRNCRGACLETGNQPGRLIVFNAFSHGVVEDLHEVIPGPFQSFIHRGRLHHSSDDRATPITNLDQPRQGVRKLQNRIVFGGQPRLSNCEDLVLQIMK